MLPWVLVGIGLIFVLAPLILPPKDNIKAPLIFLASLGILIGILGGIKVAKQEHINVEEQEIPEEVPDLTWK